MKHLIKKCIYALFSSSDTEIGKCIDRYDTISFDIFDTLVKRDVVDERHVFDILEKRMVVEFGMDVEGFALERAEAEKKTREQSFFEEITLEEIYKNIDIDTEIKEKVMGMECEIEYAICVPNIPIVKLYNECLKRGKRVLIISDMYLPKMLIQRILEKCGIGDCELILSSEHRKMKRTGGLFQNAAISDVKKWLHIGDNIRSDYLIPKKTGGNACLIKKAIWNNRYISKQNIQYRSYAELSKFISNRVAKYTDDYEIIGYEVLGPLLYSFCIWLSNEIMKDEKVLFLAREGKIIRDAYQLITGKDETYLYISRHAVKVPLLEGVDSYESFKAESINSIHRCVTAEEFGLSCGLDVEEVNAVLKSVGIASKEVVTEAQEKEIFETALNIIQKNALEQREYFLEYLSSCGLTKKNILVDVGWYGTIQLELERLVAKAFQEQRSFAGYYFGVKHDKNKAEYETLKRKGYLYDVNKSQKIQDELAYTLPFFEMLFLNPEATTRGYRKADDGSIVPILGEKENAGEEEACIMRLQKAALQFVEDMCGSIVSEYYACSSDEVFANYEVLAVKPSRHTFDLFENFKVYDGDAYYLLSRKSLLYYMLHLKEFKRDFLNNRCKLWFMKSILKVPFPYMTVLKGLKKFDSR